MELTNEHFITVLEHSLKQIDYNIQSNNGVLCTMYRKLQFEKWFQIELLKNLLGQLEDYGVNIHIEYELSQKTSKRGRTIDISIIQNDQEFIGLELKIAPTNYNITGFSKKTKRLTNVIDDFISDMDKTTGFNYSYSLVMVFPFPSDKNHRNYKDFKKQELRMIEKGNLTIWEGLQMKDFISRYYLLNKINK